MNLNDLEGNIEDDNKLDNMIKEDEVSAVVELDDKTVELDEQTVELNEKNVELNEQTVEIKNEDTNNIKNQVNNSEVEEKESKKNYVALSFALVITAAVIIFALMFVTKNLVGNKGKRDVIGNNTDKVEATVKATVSSKADDKEVQEVSTTEGESVADIVQNVMPSIVSISCVVSQEFSFFGRNYSEDAEGSGSGIIIGQNDKQVLIATNNHVIDGASTVSITFNDGEEVTAEIKGTDSSNDLAVVAVKIGDLKDSTKSAIKIASIGKSEKCKVGEMAIAIGNALGYGQSVTVGVISAIDRAVATEDYNMELIQTDAAINPGNSGGALLNSKGEVIGINSVKYVSEDTEGMGYAIPITEAVEILNELMNYEEIPESEKAYLGIVGYDIDEAFSKRSNIPKGVYIQKISDGSPAAKSGMKVGDIITEFAGKKVSTMENIQNIMKNKRRGERVEVKVQQATNGAYVEKTYTVTFGSKNNFLN